MNIHLPRLFGALKSWLGSGLLVACAASSLATTVSYTPQFLAGWNLAGNSSGSALDVKATFATQSSVQSVWKWNAAGSKWAFYAPSLDSEGTLGTYAAAKGYTVLASVNPGEGYWVNTQSVVTLGTQSGPGFSLAASDLKTGWNLAATADDVAPAAFGSAVGNVTTMWAWDSTAGQSGWYFYAPALAGNGTLASYIQGKGYKDFGSTTLANGRGFWVNYAGFSGGGGTNGGTQMGGAHQGTPLNLTPFVTTLAGNGNVGLADGTGTAARFNYPKGITTDGTNLYVADYTNNLIRKIVIATGVVTTVAGGGCNSGPLDGTGAAACFVAPTGITTDGTNLYVADNFNDRIRKVDPVTGAVTTIAGNGTATFSDGIGTAAGFFRPSGITTDGTNLYVTDTNFNRIRKIVIATSEVTTLAGSGVAAVTDGTGAAAAFLHPYGITTDGSNLYVTESNRIRKIVIATGVVSTLAGSGAAGFADGTGAAAQFYLPQDLTTDGTNLYVADMSNNRIRQVVIASGMVTTLAGSATAGISDGNGAAAGFRMPGGITTDGTSLYVMDGNNNLVRRIGASTSSIAPVVSGFSPATEVAGIGSTVTISGTFLGNFIAPLVKFGTTATSAAWVNNQTITATVPSSLTAGNTTITISNGDGTGAITVGTFVVTASGDGGNTAVGTQMGGGRQGVALTLLTEPHPYAAIYASDPVKYAAAAAFAGATQYSGLSTLAGSGANTSTNGTGVLASFNMVAGSTRIGLTSDGLNVYLAEATRIRKIEIATGIVTTLAGSATSGSTDGTGAGASFTYPQGLTTDGTNLYVTDSNYLIRKVVIATGVVTTMALSDGSGTAVNLSYPESITTDGTNLYVIDTSGSKIRKIVIATGVMTTLASSTQTASLTQLKYITTDGLNLYTTQTNQIISKIVIASGAVTTLAGSINVSGLVDGTGAAAKFSNPQGITTDGTSLYVQDNTRALRKIVIATGVVSGAFGIKDTDMAGLPNALLDLRGITTDGKSLFMVDANYYVPVTAKLRKLQ